MNESIANEFNINDFNLYRIYYHSTSEPEFNLQTHIDLFKDDVFVGRIKFMKNGTPVPPNQFRRALPFLYYSINDFENILRILTLVKPLYILLNSSNGHGMITTDSEVIPY